LDDFLFYSSIYYYKTVFVMSITTGFQINGVDISNLFQIPTTTFAAYTDDTGFKYKKADGTYEDIGRLYAANFGYNSATTTNYNYLSGGTLIDLNRRFAPKLSDLFTFDGTYSIATNVNGYKLRITITGSGNFINKNLATTCTCYAIGGGGAGGVGGGFAPGGGGAGQLTSNYNLTISNNRGTGVSIGNGGVYNDTNNLNGEITSGEITSIYRVDTNSGIKNYLIKAEGGGNGGDIIRSPNNGTNTTGLFGTVISSGSGGGGRGLVVSTNGATAYGSNVYNGGSGVYNVGISAGGGGGGAGGAGRDGIIVFDAANGFVSNGGNGGAGIYVNNVEYCRGGGGYGTTSYGNSLTTYGCGGAGNNVNGNGSGRPGVIFLFFD
jgi:hypothetical protein